MTRKLPNVSCWGYSPTTSGLHLNIVKRCASSLADEAHLFLRWIKLEDFNGKRYGTIFSPEPMRCEWNVSRIYFREARVLDTSSQ
ncbi:hypothetical protein DET54_108191 [Paenibacillus pabuli]|uniref:Uncharacterized protein n=1 Tax=Paenibacillus pabuli TaxID=1472 RepID=A0ABX9BIM4_9BACL|nr:hypothetical protein DET54_108191 [Paenibacillus pabuli]